MCRALEEDLELKLITARKLAEMRRRAEQVSGAKKERTNKEILLDVLYDRGDEVLEAALERYPKETGQIIDQLAKLIREKKFTDRVSGGELLSVFRTIGMRVSLKTTIKVQEHGRFVDLTEKLRMKVSED